MAYYVPVPGVLQANIRYRLDGQDIENVLAFKYQGTPFLTACAGLQSILSGTWWQALRVALSTSIVHNSVYYVDQSSSAGPVFTGAAFTNPAGDQATPPVPNNCAMCVSGRTANRGRSYRARSYVAGIPRLSVTASRIDPSLVAVVVDAYEDLRVAADAALIPMVVISRNADNLPRVTGLATVITSWLSLDNVIDSQRRRLPGRGR